MSRSLILILAAIVTIGGLVAVVWAARQILRLGPLKARLLAGIFLFVYGTVVIIRPSAWPVIDLAVLVGAAGAAVLVGGSLSSIGAVVTFLLAAAAVDILSVTGGLTRAIIDGYRDGASDLLLYLALVVPIDGRIIPIVGISDLLISGSAAIALVRRGLRPIVVIGAIAIGLLGALAYGIWQGGVAALPFIAVAVVLLAWRYSAASTRHVDGEPAQ